MNWATEIRLEVDSLGATQTLASEIARLARPGDVIVLTGQMGSGKTAFTQGFARALGVDEPVTSPTFTLINTYESGRLPLHHVDLYRLDRQSEVADLALGDLAESDGILIIEWGEAAADLLGDRLEVEIEHSLDNENGRVFTVRSVGSAWTTRWSALRAAVAPWRETTSS